jgi:N-acetylneuraminate lyase
MTGLVAATFTPMRADGSLWLEQVGPVVDRLVEDGLGGLYVCGSTGEGPSLSVQERQETAAAFVQAAAGRLPVVVQVGHTSLAEARRLAAHAAQIGADAISAVPPWYYQPDSVEVVVDCMAEIVAVAPGLPFYYYHIPKFTGVELDVLEFLRCAGPRLESLAGIKYTAPTVDEFQALIELDGGRYDILFGRDEMLLSGLGVGARGAIGTTYNFAAPLYRRLMDAFEQGRPDEARTQQARAVQMIRLLARHGSLPAFKAVMGLLGQDCGFSRLPLRSLTADQTARMAAELEAAGFFEWGR